MKKLDNKVAIITGGAGGIGKATALEFLNEGSDVLLFDLNESNFFYTNWFNLSKMEEYHDLDRWNSDWYSMLDKYAKLMASGRQNCVKIPRELIYLKDNEVYLDEEKMISFINIFLKYGFK